jgi:hypothetical protein
VSDDQPTALPLPSDKCLETVAYLVSLAEAKQQLARHLCTGTGDGHAADYHWLIGELQYSEVRSVWRLRYAGAEADDSFGGSVTLLAPSPMTAYRSGQRVFVEGQLIDPHSTEPSPSYRVQSIQPIP